jgi:hypothetical protein
MAISSSRLVAAIAFKADKAGQADKTGKLAWFPSRQHTFHLLLPQPALCPIPLQCSALLREYIDRSRQRLEKAFWTQDPRPTKVSLRHPPGKPGIGKKRVLATGGFRVA